MEYEDDGDDSFSQIACGPSSMAPKLLVGIASVESENRKTVYQLQLSLVDTDHEWSVRRRYSEFLQVRDDLRLLFYPSRVTNQCFGCRWFLQSLRGFEFPRKHLVTSKDPEVIRSRKLALDRFARLVSSHTFSGIPRCVRCSQTPFDLVKDFFTRNATVPSHTSLERIRNTLVPERFAPIVDPSKSKIEFRRGYGIFKMLQVEKPIYLTWEEHGQAQRRKRLEARMSLESVDGASDDITIEETASRPPSALCDDDELDLTGIQCDLSTDSPAASHRRPLPKRHPRAESNLWERWELAAPTPPRTAAKEA
ncbi:hypothetical protein Poli38472_000684 [Pythium oligandrum]|uniref:PX domain-containing protein n=1 Tax=Pythium oligandrum TaxID=41045 RepID=A0A8K1CE91_PYTOL|nr:hypothetical protein Poli38472_000684 [Pythium oligandrum]|eukprot:TMW60642.1 hypothetical protein Poli38472_000684 [Pythium oligandrum]